MKASLSAVAGVLLLFGGQDVGALRPTRTTAGYLAAGAALLGSQVQVAQASRNTQVVNCNGPGNSCSPSNTPNISPSVSGTLAPSVSAQVPMIPTKRSLSQLFFGDHVADIYARAPPKGGAAKSGGGPKQAKGGAKPPPKQRPLLISEVVSMINSGQALPKPLQGPAAAFAKKEGLTPPSPATLKPTPPQLADHPCEEALKILNSGKIPKEVLTAAHAKWGKGGAGAGAGKSAKGGPPSPKATPPKGGKKGKRALYERDAIENDLMDLFGRDAVFEDDYTLYAREPESEGLFEREAEPAEGVYYDYNLWARDVDLYGPLELEAREAEPNEDADIYVREAEPDAFDGEEFFEDLYSRDAAYNDNDFSLYARYTGDEELYSF